MEFKTKEIKSTKRKTEVGFETVELDGKGSDDKMRDSQSRPETGKWNDSPGRHGLMKTKDEFIDGNSLI
jgi:hypothetical protein